MNPGPQLHRSLTLWAGLLVIIFTCWSWRDSCTHVALVQWKQIWTGNSLRGFYLLRVPGWNNHVAFERSPWKHLITVELEKPFQPPFLVRPKGKDEPTSNGSLREQEQTRVNRLGPGSFSLYLPYWLILPPIILAWTTLLILRSRRLGRLRRCNMHHH